MLTPHPDKVRRQKSNRNPQRFDTAQINEQVFPGHIKMCSDLDPLLRARRPRGGWRSGLRELLAHLCEEGSLRGVSWAQHPQKLWLIEPCVAKSAALMHTSQRFCCRGCWGLDHLWEPLGYDLIPVLKSTMHTVVHSQGFFKFFFLRCRLSLVQEFIRRSQSLGPEDSGQTFWVWARLGDQEGLQ